MSAHLMAQIRRQPGVSEVWVRQRPSLGDYCARIDLDMAHGVALCSGYGRTEIEALESARDQMERCLLEPSPWDRGE